MFRWLIAIGVTLLLHGLLLLLSRPLPEPELPKMQKISIRVVPKAATEATPVANPPTKLRPSKPSPSPKQSSQSRATRYADLLPHAGDIPTVVSKAPASTNVVSGDSASALPPGILKFSQLLADYIDVPDALRLHFSSGKSEVFIQRQKSDRYFVKRARGDAYFRALLFDRIKEVLETPGNTDELQQQDVAQLRVRLEFRKLVLRNAGAFKGPQREVRVAGDVVTLAFTEVVQDLKWAMFAATPGEDGGPPIGGFNILVPVLMLAEYLNPPKMEGDPTLRALRASPAFIKAIP